LLQRDVLRPSRIENDVTDMPAVSLSDERFSDPPNGVQMKNFRRLLEELEYIDTRDNCFCLEHTIDAPSYPIQFYIESLACPEFHYYTAFALGTQNHFLLTTIKQIVVFNTFVDYICSLLSFDGTFMLQRIPLPNEVSLWTRILHRRLDTLGLFEGNIPDPYGKNTERALLSLVECTTKLDVLDKKVIMNVEPFMVARSESADLLIQYLCMREPSLSLVFFELVPERLPPTNPLDFKRSRGNRIAEKPISVDDKALLTCPDFPKCESRQQIEWLHKAYSEKSNRLGRRLLQIKMAQIGFYDGFIDGYVGPRTRNGLCGMSEAYGFSMDDILRSLGYGYCEIDLVFLTENVFLLDQTLSLKNANILFELGAKAEAAVSRLIYRFHPKVLQSVLATSAKKQNEMTFPSTRIIKTAVGALIHGFVHMPRLVERGIRPLCMVLKTAINGAKLAIELGNKSLEAWRHLIIGLPIITNKDRNPNRIAVITHFELNCNAIVFAVSGVNSDELHRHRAQVHRFSEGVSTALKIVSVFAKFPLKMLNGAFGWVRFAFEFITFLNVCAGR
jgi:peptidoglycan hydrolase-like protein with peptidoglycan-binding domain